MSEILATAEVCRAEAVECGRRAQQYTLQRHYYSAKLEIEQARRLVLKALDLEQKSLPTPAATPTDSANPPPVESVGPNPEAQS